MADFNYVDGVCELVWPLPARCDGLSLDGFLTLAPDLAKLQALVDRTFRATTQGAVSFAALPLLFFSFGSYQKAYSLDPAYRARGAIAYREVAVWTYLLATRDIPHGPRRGELAIWVPSIWVDSQYALTGGREMLGIAKGLADVTLPDGPDAQALWSMRTAAIEHFSPDAIAAPFELLSVTRTDGATRGDRASTWSALREAADMLEAAFREGTLVDPMTPLPGALDHVEEGLGASFDFVKAMLASKIPTVSLRQFRSPDSTTAASFQQVEFFEASMANLTLYALEGAHRVTVNPCDSHPIAETLGITGPLSAFGVHMGCDLGLPQVTTLWP